MGEHDSGSQHDFRAACTMHGKCFSPAYTGWVYGCPELLGNRLGSGQVTDPLSAPEPGEPRCGVVTGSGWAPVSPFAWQRLQSARALSLQVLRYFDYVFTGVFTFEMVIKVRGLAGWLRWGCCVPQRPCSGWEIAQFFSSGPKFG